MNSNISIVIDDQNVLHGICGINDTNLKLLETLLDEKIIYRGNEVLIESTDQKKRAVFTRVIDQLKEHVILGHHPGPDLIRALFDSVQGKEDTDARLLKEQYIAIPQRNLNVFPRSINQARYVKILRENQIVFSIGPAGTGKTYLAVAYAVSEILNKRAGKLILTRPVVEAGESLGFLPGDFTQKISPYLRPLYDALDTFVSIEMINRMEENRAIEIVPLAYMRGRSLSNSLIILDEAQNTTVSQMKMFLTRIGEGSKAVITGDVTQIDLTGEKRSGLLHVRNLLKNIEGIRFIHFTRNDVVRNPLVKKIVEAYEKER